VRIAGVKVGKVLNVQLKGDHVEVSFRTNKGVKLGELTRAAIKVKTLVGQDYLALEPEGTGNLKPKVPIPTTRTTPAYEVIPAFQDLSQTLEQIDDTQLERAVNVLSDTFQNTAPDVRDALTGLSRISNAIAARDEQLRSLLAHARDVTGVLASRDQELRQLINSADQVLQVISARKALISDLLRNVVNLSQQVSGLIADTRPTLNPALTNLQTVIRTLNDNSASITRTMQVLPVYLRLFSNTIGNGHWFDTFITNFLDPSTFVPQIPGLDTLPGATSTATAGGGSTNGGSLPLNLPLGGNR
jgi:phospholipid/cholesterol/gamma-HCH transport system substrate-binding protein